MSDLSLIERLRIDVEFLTPRYKMDVPVGSEPSWCLSPGELAKVRATCSDAANRIYQLDAQLREADALVRRYVWTVGAVAPLTADPTRCVKAAVELSHGMNAYVAKYPALDAAQESAP